MTTLSLTRKVINILIEAEKPLIFSEIVRRTTSGSDGIKEALLFLTGMKIINKEKGSAKIFAKGRKTQYNRDMVYYYINPEYAKFYGDLYREETY